MAWQRFMRHQHRQFADSGPDSFFRFTNDYPDLEEVLSISSNLEPPLMNGIQPYVTFEWIGEKNYLNERWGSRGQNCTSVDVMFRFRTRANKIQIVLAEWKYCESDRKAKYQHVCSSGIKG
jgi:hypothetical protein